MKKTIVTVLLFASTFMAQGQTNKVKEYGIGLYGLNDFSLQYRWGTEKKLYRVSGFFGLSSNKSNDISSRVDSINNTKSIGMAKGSTPYYLSFGIGFSILNLKPINDKFGLIVGPNLSTSVFLSSQNSINTKVDTFNGIPFNDPYNEESKSSLVSVRPSIGLVLGCYYSFNPKLFLYAEIQPNFYLQYTKTERTYSRNYVNANPSFLEFEDKITSEITSYGISNISNSGAMITLAYRISK